MVLNDSGLVNFSLAIAASAGAFLAISASIWIFLFDRRNQDEISALRQARSSADSLHRFLAVNVSNKDNYLKSLPNYIEFIECVSEMSEPYSIDSIPSFLRWRTLTAPIAEITLHKHKPIKEAVEKLKRGEAVKTEDQRFHLDFIGLMFNLDLSIQEVDWAKGVRKKGIQSSEAALGIALFLVLFSLIVALSGSAKTENGISDDWNFLFASLMIGNVFLLLVFLVYSFMTNKVSRVEWIKMREKEIRRLVSKASAKDNVRDEFASKAASETKGV